MTPPLAKVVKPILLFELWLTNGSATIILSCQVDLQARANYQRIATFQAHNIGTSLRKAQQQLVNLLLHCINQSSNIQITNKGEERYKVLSWGRLNSLLFFFQTETAIWHKLCFSSWKLSGTSPEKSTPYLKSLLQNARPTSISNRV